MSVRPLRVKLEKIIVDVLRGQAQLQKDGSHGGTDGVVVSVKRSWILGSVRGVDCHRSRKQWLDYLVVENQRPLP